MSGVPLGSGRPSHSRSDRGRSRRARLAPWLKAGFIVGCLGASLAVAGVVSAQDPTQAPGADASASPAASVDPNATATPVPVNLPLELVAPSATPEPLIPGPTAMPVIVHPKGSDPNVNSCADCHTSLKPEQQAIVEDWKASIHGQNGVGCADCHGGDPTSDRMGVAMSRDNGFIGKPDRQQTIMVCGSCHSDPNVMKSYNLPTDEFSKYWTSVHGQQLLKANDTQVAICTDCHGKHDIRKTTDPTAKVYTTNVPELCASCHADATKMEPYGIPTDQYAIYQQSVHGKALLEDADVRAPNCASCHGSHDAKPPTSDTVVNVCGSCHTATEDLYKQSRHAELGAAAPKCWTCHGTHDVQQPSAAIFLHKTPPDYTCDTCHDLQTKQLRITTAQFLQNPDERHCDTCHHTDSDIYAQVKAIDEAVVSAQTAYDSAQAKIDEAAGLGMIVSDANVTLADAKTSLIKGEAAVHTTKLTLVSQSTDDAKAKAAAAEAIAQAKLDQSIFRREAMVVVVGIILLIVVALLIVKRSIEKGRKATEAGPG